MTTKEFRKLWIDALKSNTYTQTKGKLVQIINSNKTFCCLGVACDIYSKNYPNQLTFVKLTEPVPSAYKYPENEDKEFFNELPPIVQKALGLNSPLGDLSYTSEENTYDSLAEINDSHYQQFTFEQIAQIIESHAHELFIENDDEPTPN